MSETMKNQTCRNLSQPLRHLSQPGVISYCSVEWALLAPLQATENLPVNYNLPIHSRPHLKEDFKNNLIIWNGFTF